MLFNSAEFIFLFLPLTLLGFQFAQWQHGRLAMGWLIVASLCFYSYFNPANLPLLLASVGFNYAVGWLLLRARGQLQQRLLLAIGIGVDLLLIGYFKYANFFMSSLNQLGANFPLGEIVLPLGISFFTFQQIACLVDLYRGRFSQSYTLLNYVCFITFFPYLISGPLLHFDQVVPQFSNRETYKFKAENLAVGITIFAIGLFKKAQIADSLALHTNQVFAAANGTSLTFFEAWLGALGFTLQLYFDFSGYSDMAIGVARMFGIRLPVNFSSPYKAESIVDFWRRWHITLSNFLRDYLYIPLGGNRKGEVRRNMNLILTMLIGGLWHGAGWNFVIWGGLHGVYLVVNHQWRSLQRRLWGDVTQRGRWLGCGITFLAVVVSWVFFRSPSFAVAQNVLQGMAGMQGISLPETFSGVLGFLQGVRFEGFMPNIDIKVNAIEDIDTIDSTASLRKIGLLLLFVWFMPNTQQWLAQYEPTANPDPSPPVSIGSPRLWKLMQWRPSPFWAVVTALLTIVAMLNLAQVQEFLYFEF